MSLTHTDARNNSQGDVSVAQTGNQTGMWSGGKWRGVGWAGCGTRRDILYFWSVRLIVAL